MNLPKFGALICVFLFATPTVIAGKSRSKLRQLKSQIKTCTSNNMFICALDPNDRKCDLTCIPRDQECDGKPQCPMKDDEHCPTGQCGRTPLSSVFINFNGPDILSIPDFRKYSVERKLTAYLNMVDVTNGLIPPHYQLNRTMKEIEGPKFMYTNTYKRRATDLVCEKLPGVADPIDNKAFFRKIIRNDPTTADFGIIESVFSSCPDKYIYTFTCIGYNFTTNTCLPTNGCLLLLVPEGSAALDDFPYQQALIDLDRNTNLKLGGNSNIQTLNISGQQLECTEIVPA